MRSRSPRLIDLQPESYNHWIHALRKSISSNTDECIQSSLHSQPRPRSISPPPQTLVTGLREAKVFTASGDCSVKCFPEVLVAVVLRQVKLVEAGMTAGQTILCAIVAMNVESTEAVHAFELLEAIEWNLGSTSDELK